MYNFKEFEYIIIYITKYHEKIMKIWRNLCACKKSILDTQYGNVPNVHSDLWALAQKSLSVNTIFYAIQTQVKTQRCYDVKMVQEKTSAVSQIHTQLKSLFLVLINIKQPFRMTCNWNIGNQRLITWKMYM